MIRTWVLDRLRCRWVLRWLTETAWKRLPHVATGAVIGVCAGQAPWLTHPPVATVPAPPAVVAPGPSPRSPLTDGGSGALCCVVPPWAPTGPVLDLVPPGPVLTFSPGELGPSTPLLLSPVEDRTSGGSPPPPPPDHLPSMMPRDVPEPATAWVFLTVALAVGAARAWQRLITRYFLRS